MPLNDTITIPGGLSQQIVDWSLGDDRIFTGVPAGLPTFDQTLTDCYFTIKSAPVVADALALLQLHITQALTTHGQIIVPNTITVHVFSADYEGLVFLGPTYYWDFRVITSLGSTYTIASGTVIYVQNVTQTNAAGTPGPIPMGPNNGQPRFRGFINKNPMLVPNLSGTFVQGDYYRNSSASSAAPSGWVCIVGGSLPNPPGAASFRTDGLIGNSP